jgi:oxygen-independent coproporphyrinogen-3 oxidase
LDREGIRGVFSAAGRFPLAVGAEVTIEANPQDVTEDRLGLWREFGVGRVSLGVQSLDPEGLGKALGRTHGPGEARAAARLVLAYGAELSVDLIYGWSGQTPTVWERDLRGAAELGARHVSAYALTPAAGTPLAAWLSSGELAPLPEEGTAASMFLAAGRILGEAGLRRYEVSNFAVPGSECRHNMRYWRRVPYLGLGPSAHTFDGALRRGNLASLSGWSEALRGGRDPAAFTEAIGPDEEKLETLMLGLRLSEGLEAWRLEGSPALEALVGDGLLERAGERIVPSERGMLVADWLARTFS